jgi:hypothetical protein
MFQQAFQPTWRNTKKQQNNKLRTVIIVDEKRFIFWKFDAIWVCVCVCESVW